MFRNSLKALLGSCSVLVVANASAYLGSFAPADGYSLSVFNGSANWCDVTHYNAGQYGVNAGNGAGPTPIAPNSQLWTVVSQAGGFFPTAAARNAAIGGAPPYPNTVPAGTIPSYIVGNHFPGRGGDGNNLAVRNDSPTGTGAIVYDYSIDTYDTGGTVPSTVTSGPVSTQFYYLPNPSMPVQPGTRGPDKFTMSFRDSGGNTGLEWGYAADNEVYWRNASGPWNYTGIYADAGDWDGIDVNIDLTADTFGIDYYDVGTNTWFNLVPAGTALATPMTDLTVLRWQLEDNVSSGIGGKNFFDDFTFHIPEPSTLALLGVGALLMRRRRA